MLKLELLLTGILLLNGVILTPHTFLSSYIHTCPYEHIDIPIPNALTDKIKKHQKGIIVDFGSSSTYGEKASSEQTTYPSQMQQLLHFMFPNVDIKVINSGHSGDAIREMNLRLDRDVIGYHPDLVIWQTGANDVIRKEIPEFYRSSLEDGLNKLKANNIQVIIMGNQSSEVIMKSEDHEKYEILMKDIAEKRGLGYISRKKLAISWAKNGVPISSLFANDGIHQNDKGYACIAETVVDNLYPYILDSDKE